MPIEGITQPEILTVDDEVRLRRFDGSFDFALSWYLDEETVWLVDGVREPYTPEKLARMYRWLDEHGELYFIETLRNGVFQPIGDVTFSRDDLPIVIGDRQARGQRIGRRVLSALLNRARELGYSDVSVREIYAWNPISRRCFESLGFRQCARTEKGYSYTICLK